MTKNIFLVILTALLILATIRTCNLQRELDSVEEETQFLKDHPSNSTQPSVNFSSSIELPKSKPFEVTPSKFTYPKLLLLGNWSPDSVLNAHESPSTQDSVAGISLNQNRLTLTFSNPLHGLHQAEFHIKPNDYEYVWVDGKLSAKRLPLLKRWEFHPYSALTFRPIHNLWDLEAGISFKTKSLNYNLGINGFYYPKFQKNPGIDAVIRITYTF